MGSGKSFIIYNLIEEHRKKYNKNNGIYMIVCDRLDILQSMFFTKDGEIDRDKKKFLKDNAIINLNNFYIEERVFGTKKEKEIITQHGRPTILVINSSFLKTIYDYDEKIKKVDLQLTKSPFTKPSGFGTLYLSEAL
jgi:hypothetical protein